MTTRIFSTKFDDKSEESVNDALRVYENWDLSKENIVFIADEILHTYDVEQHPRVNEYIAVFTDDQNLYKGLQKYVAEWGGETCRIGGLIEAECIIVIYEIQILEKPSDDELITVFCGDIAAASEPISRIGILEIDEGQLRFIDGVMARYLFYLDQLTNYIQFRKKLGAAFDLIFRKVKEFNLKFLKIKSDIRGVIAEVKALEQDSENPRPALIVHSIHRYIGIDEHSLNNRIQNLDEKISEISEYTRSVNELRQASIGESLNNIMFWIAIISFFFGMIAIYDKYQSSSTFNISANEAFFNTGFLMLPFALLFIWVFLRNGAIFEAAGRFIKNFKFKARSHVLFRTSRILWRDIGHADLDWYDFIESQITDLALELIPKGNRVFEMVDDDLPDGDEGLDALRDIYAEEIYPKTSFVYATLYEEISEKLQAIVLDKKNLKPLSQKKQFDGLIAEVCVFTALTNWRLEADNYIEEDDFRALDWIGFSVFFEVFKDKIINSSDQTEFDTPFIALRLKAAADDDYEAYMPLARYLAAEEPKLKLLFDELEEVADDDEEFVPGRTVLLLSLLDREDYDYECYPSWLSDEYVNVRLGENGSVESRLKEIKDEFSEDFSNGVFFVNVLEYLDDYCREYQED